MGVNHSVGESLQTFGLESHLIPRIDAARKPRYKTRASFFRAAALDLLERMEREPKTLHPIRNHLGSRGEYLPEPEEPAMRAEDKPASSGHAGKVEGDNQAAGIRQAIRKRRTPPG